MQREEREYRGRIKQSTLSAETYLQRPKSKHKGEMVLVRRAFSIVPVKGRVLDIPCGAGRATILLQQLGYDATGADIGDGVLETARAEVARAGLHCAIEKQDLEAIKYQDDAFDTILCFRLFHHLPSDDVRARIVSELCRVAATRVVISYLSPVSVTSIKRSIRAALGGKRSRQFATSLASIELLFADQGFALVKDFSRLAFLHTLHLAVFERR